MKKMEQKEKKYPYVSVKVKPETYGELIKTRAMYEIQLGRRLSMDSVIRIILAQLPVTEVKLRQKRVKAESEGRTS